MIKEFKSPIQNASKIKDSKFTALCGRGEIVRRRGADDKQ